MMEGIEKAVEKMGGVFARAGEMIITYLCKGEISNDDIKYIHSLEKCFDEAIKGKMWIINPLIIPTCGGKDASNTYLLAKRALEGAGLKGTPIDNLYNFKEIIYKIKQRWTLEKKEADGLIKFIHVVLEGYPPV